MRREISYSPGGLHGVLRIRIGGKRLRVLAALLAAETSLTGRQLANQAEYRGTDFFTFLDSLRDAGWVTAEPDSVPRPGTTGVYPLLYQLTPKGRAGSEILSAPRSGVRRFLPPW